MRISTASRRVTAMACSLAVLAFAATGCGDDDNESGSASSGTTQTQTSNSSATPSTNDKAVALLPAKIKSKGTLTVAMDASYAPNEFFEDDGKTIQGMDVDLAKALAASLGLKAKPVNAGFDGIIPGLQAGKYDLGMSSFTDTKEREKAVDFVTYLKAGTSFYVKAQGGPDIQGLDSLCGQKVAVEKGTVQQTDAEAQDKKCKSAGKTGVQVSVFPDQNGANLALNSGRANVGMADSPVADYAVKQSGGQFKLVGTPYAEEPYGIAIPKDSGMTKAVQAAIQGLMDDGTYEDVLKKWGVESGAIETAEINGAVS
jgi:polar amino acid transport system substrate-binding protein